MSDVQESVSSALCKTGSLIVLMLLVIHTVGNLSDFEDLLLYFSMFFFLCTAA